MQYQLLLLVLLLLVALTSIALRWPQMARQHMGNLAVLSTLLNAPTEPPFLASSANSYLAGVWAYQHDNFESADSLLVNSSDTRPELALWYRGKALNASDKWQQALEEINLASASGRDLFLEILFEHWEELSPDTLVQYEEEIRQYPDMIVEYASRLMSETQRFEDSAFWARQLPNYEQSVAARILVGRSQYYLRNYGEAEAIFADLIDETRQVAVLYWYGKILSNTGRADEAIVLFEEALWNNPQTLQGRLVEEILLACAKINKCTETKVIRDWDLVEMNRETPRELCSAN